MRLRLNMDLRDPLKGLYVVARISFLLVLNRSAWPCLGPAYQSITYKLFSSPLYTEITFMVASIARVLNFSSHLP